MQPLKILFCLLGDRTKASSRVRGYWMAEEFEKRGIQCTIVAGGNRKSLLLCLAMLPNHDVIFFQKDSSKWHIRLLRIANLMGKITLFDLDDAPSRVNRAVTMKNAGRMIAGASAVMAGSQALLQYVRQYNQNAFFLPTCIKLENYIPAAKNYPVKAPCIGWIGNGAHYAEDLVQILSGPLRHIGATRQVRFKLVGACGNKKLYDAFSDIRGVETVFVDQICWSDPASVRNHLAEFDIGLYPVLDTEFNRYKCAFKALEYMAMRIPVVVSPIGANSYVVENGIDGFHANDTKEWIGALNKLISDPAARNKFGQAGRRKVKTQYSISGSAMKLSSVMRQLEDAETLKK